MEERLLELEKQIEIMKRRNKCVDDHLIALRKLIDQYDEKLSKVNKKINKIINKKGLTFNQAIEYFDLGYGIRQKHWKSYKSSIYKSEESISFSLKQIKAKNWIFVE